MTAYTVFRRPDDQPDVPFLVREFHILGGARAVQPGPILGTADTLAGARQLIPESHGLCLSRSPGDPWTVVETWI